MITSTGGVRGREPEKLKTGGESMVQGQVFLQGGGGLTLFLRFIIFHLEITLPFAKLCYSFEEKLFFSVTIIL